MEIFLPFIMKIEFDIIDEALGGENTWEKLMKHIRIRSNIPCLINIFDLSAKRFGLELKIASSSITEWMTKKKK